jgi:hypothetical protein
LTWLSIREVRSRDLPDLEALKDAGLIATGESDAKGQDLTGSDCGDLSRQLSEGVKFLITEWRSFKFKPFRAFQFLP